MHTKTSGLQDYSIHRFDAALVVYCPQPPITVICAMSLWKLRRKSIEWTRFIGRISPAAIILGSALNILEAGEFGTVNEGPKTLAKPYSVSIGLLIFPPAEHQDAFSGLQTQAMALYIIRQTAISSRIFRNSLTEGSTVTSQAALTFGRSAFPCALGSMLAEVLPFLRNIAIAIQKELGQSHPGILPTTVVAYALTSFLLGAMFTVLAVLKCGRLVGYFPNTVMQGVIGKSSRRTRVACTDEHRWGGSLAVSTWARDHVPVIHSF